ncbi:KAP family NTPase [Salipiger bermudensis]|uniref:KAP family P-loop NTPase fold protein n=1 Tax=Salipiger bermudensis TaxID=344736 RepID=UPI001C9A188F|nr:P-loop NTPase fold protein [Salipiger bermudensis]MBY6005869.1 KAP family NTPase [Salipiger bermudensis]
MKLFPQDDDVVLYETGFEDDVLERKSISNQLSELVERIENPVVLALDDKWGSGKTFFLKRWVAAHTAENNGTATTIYFDAFENDYLTDPLVSIITAVSARLPDEQAETVKKWKTVATKLAKPALGIALSVATFGAKQYLDEMGDVIADAASGEAKNAVQDLWEVERVRKDAMHDFRNLLSELTQKSAAPIVIVVDELDRCRPDYALTVLEVIKHFFSVPKVHFILGVNGKALENSVKARYGADIDAESYLRKFINVSFSLPRAIGGRGEVSVFSKYASKLISDMELPQRVSDRCVSLLKCVVDSRDVSLRDIGKVFSKVALVPDEVHKKNFKDGYIDILCALIVTSVVDPQLHAKLVSGDAQTSELRDYLAAPKEKTIERIDDTYNSAYNHEVTTWLATIIFCCGREDIENVEGLPSWSENLGERFDRFGVRDRKSIAPGIQKDWVEIFRV